MPETQTRNEETDELEKLKEEHSQAVEEKKPRRRRRKKIDIEAEETKDLEKSLSDFTELLRPLVTIGWNGVCVGWLKSQPVSDVEINLWTPPAVKCLVKWFPLLTEWKEELALLGATAMIVVPRLIDREKDGNTTSHHDSGKNGERQNDAVKKPQAEILQSAHG